MKKNKKKVETYGLTEYDLSLCQEKIELQRDYLEKNELITSNGQVKRLIDLSFSANHSERYYAQLANKINTMENIAINERLVPNFLTITLDGFYRDLIRGDYKRFNALRADKRSQALKSVPNNEKLGFVRDKMRNNEKLSIKDLYNVLNYQVRQFRNGYAFKKLKKDDKTYIYVRTVEPHKDGVPHFHMMFFIPSDYVPMFKKDFVRYFVAPENAKPEYDRFKKPIKDTLKCFQTDINNASAYIMKYITKSFLDVKNNNQLDYLNAWFVKHRIMRCVTSRSVLPQWIYQKVSIFEKDWSYLTDILNSKSLENQNEWNQEEDYFYLYDNWSDREIVYQYGQLSIYSKGVLVKRAGKIVVKPYKMISYENVPKQWSKQFPPIPIYKDKILIGYIVNGTFKEYRKHISDMSDWELVEYHNSYDYENDTYIYYLAIKNLMIDRGLLQGEKFDLNNFDFDRFFISA